MEQQKPELTQQLTPERMTEIKQALRDIQVTSANQAIIQDNKLLFLYNDKSYRVRMPNQEEQNKAEQEQNKLKINLYKDKGNVTRRQWIKILKESQDIDIEELTKEKEKFRQELQDVMLEEALISSDEKEKLQDSELKKLKIEEKFMTTVIEIAEALSPCIEEQAKMQYYRYLSYSCAELKNEKNEYISIWKSFDEFKKDDTGLSHKSIDAIQSLLLHIRD